jgi:hypothetical protein
MKVRSASLVFASGLLLAFYALAQAQDSVSTGSLVITAKPNIGEKQERIARKRFYLLPGGLEGNKALVDRIKSAKPTSIDCFYCQAQASPQYIAWLKAADCESPYCREIGMEDVAKVPEFKAAYDKALTQYGNKPSIAQKWLINHLAPTITRGFFDEQKSFLRTLLGEIKPIGSALTDSVGFKAKFINIPLKSGDKPEAYLVSNVLPIQLGGKTYTWVCEVAVTGDEVAELNLEIPEKDTAVKNCEVIIRDAPACSAGTCASR